MNSVYEYLQSYISMIPSQTARMNTAKEIAAHIQDQASDYMKEGFEQEDAFSKAVKDMGNPDDAGKAMGMLYKRTPIHWYFLLVAACSILFYLTFHFLIPLKDLFSDLDVSKKSLLENGTWIIGSIGILISLYVSYFEAQDETPFLNGKTQSLGINNSFTGLSAGIVICTAFVPVYMWALCTGISLILCYFIRRLSALLVLKKECTYLFCFASVRSIRNYKGYVLVDGKKLRVWSLRETLPEGTNVQIVEFRGCKPVVDTKFFIENL